MSSATSCPISPFHASGARPTAYLDPSSAFHSGVQLLQQSAPTSACRTTFLFPYSMEERSGGKRSSPSSFLRNGLTDRIRVKEKVGRHVLGGRDAGREDSEMGNTRQDEILERLTTRGVTSYKKDPRCLE